MARRVWPLVLSAILAGCGPSLKEMRRYLPRSPHRSVALVPLDRQGGQTDFSPQTTRLLEGRLRRAGFTVTGPVLTAPACSSATWAGRSYPEFRQAAGLAQAWGATAVLVGEVAGAYERVDKRAPEVRFTPVPPPPCCYDPRKPCAPKPVYDPKVDHYVPNCSGWHRRLVAAPARRVRTAGLTLRLRLVDSAARTVLWEGSYESPRLSGSLRAAAEQAAAVLSDELFQAYLKRGL